ncbi:uncharacterized protein LOC134535717 isoform X1 [Bacillus rossius redtenbacheri]|uniref:uncharacterized protein LOC134535717 isoform X1 n=1 Tax=Bacillus rossius redtenbacheri TaxID=93214 RepID=UPI002FDDD677
MGKCRFRSEWLERRDDNGYIINEWAKKRNDTDVFCAVCCVTIKISTKGYQALSQHATCERHKSECRNKLAPSQLKFSVVRPSCSASTSREVSSENHVKCLYSVRDRATSAELKWVMKCIITNYSASSCRGTADVFKSMFDEGVPEDFSLSSTKFRYLLTDALSPYFRNLILKDMDGAYYSVCYDEATNHTGRKELQIAIRYWSNTKLQIITHHLETFFIGSATGKILVEKINSALDNAGLPRQKILMLGSDGPNVNKKVARIICEELVSIRKAPLVNIGTCSIHTLHNAFLSGLDKLGEDVADLVMAVHDFFDGWPSRCEDYLQIQDDLSVPKHSFIKHVPSRWLTLEGAASRLIEQWEALKKYFLSYVPKKRNSLDKSNNYKRIVSLLKKPTIKAELLFVCSSARVFTCFTGAFQKEEPMIHVMHDELDTLAKILLGKVCKPELIQTVGVSEDLLKTENLLPAQKIHVEKEILTEISKVDERFQLEFLAGVKNHYVEAVTRVIRKSLLILKPLLKNCRCL